MQMLRCPSNKHAVQSPHLQHLDANIWPDDPPVLLELPHHIHCCVHWNGEAHSIYTAEHVAGERKDRSGSLNKGLQCCRGAATKCISEAASRHPKAHAQRCTALARVCPPPAATAFMAEMPTTSPSRLTRGPPELPCGA